MKIYFKNLDGIRFIAALLVVIHHSFFFKRNYSRGPEWLNDLFHDAGRMGVNLFFVLSGFLISYLLMVEKDKTGTISYRKFYIRRILRIWPLYLGFGLIITFLGPVIAQQLGTEEGVTTGIILRNLFFLVLFAVNIQLAIYNTNPGVFEISWSVCIEEQFYLIWPIIVNVFRKHLVKVFIFMFVLRTLLWALVIILPDYLPVTYEQLAKIDYLLLFDKLDLFGGGMIAALLLYNRDKHQAFFKRIMHPGIQVVMYALALLYILAVLRPFHDEKNLFLVDHVICIILFGYVLLAAVDEKSLLRLEHPFIKKLGVISYGIYLFHASICQLVFISFSKWVQHPESVVIYNVVYPLVCLTITCVVAYFSYEYFEKFFLRKKAKFALVETRV